MANGTNGNGTNWWLRWLVGAIWGIITVAMLTLASNVIANDKASRDRDDVIEHSSIDRHAEQAKQLAAVQADIREIKTVQCYIQRDQKEGFEEVKEMIKELHANGQ